jgi:hypothetical protein
VVGALWAGVLAESVDLLGLLLACPLMMLFMMRVCTAQAAVARRSATLPPSPPRMTTAQCADPARLGTWGELRAAHMVAQTREPDIQAQNGAGRR